MGGFRKSLGWLLVGLSLLLHGLTVYCFSAQPDRLAAFTVLPLWFWGGIGLFLACAAFYCLRAPLSMVMTLVWALTLLIGSDEAKVLGNLTKEAPKSGPAEFYKKTPVTRVITANCAIMSFGDPVEDIARWQPDIVLLQDIESADVRRFFTRLYGGEGDFRSFETNGIITRWKIQREVRTPGQRCQQVTITRPDGVSFEVVNIHLLSAATDLRFWNRHTWTDHRVNRALRTQELSATLKILEATTAYPHTPVILGGDFNAPPGDVSHRMLARDFTDTFAAAGRGWGDTFQRRFPVLRIDHIYATRHFTPVRSGVILSKHSDHRFVVTDLTGGR